MRPPIQAANLYGALPMTIPVNGEVDYYTKQEMLRKLKKMNALEQQIKHLENYVKTMQGLDNYSGMSFTNLSIVLDIKFFTDFKMPDFTKYDGSGDLYIHLRVYIGELASKLGEYTTNEKIKVHLFQKSLIKVALR